nr:PAS domain S-box protein [Rhizobium sp. Q54]
MVAVGAPLDEILNALASYLEAQDDGLTCAILPLRGDGEHLRFAMKSRLPKAYHDVLGGFATTPPYLAPCFEAVHTKKTVWAPDIVNDERWAPQWKELLFSCGFASCLSTPVIGSDGRALACLDLYHQHPRDPHAERLEYLETAVHLAAIAIERQKEVEERSHVERKLSSELAATQQLQAISTLLIQENDPDTLHEHIVDAAMSLMSSDAASMQLFDSQAAALHLLASRGLHPDAVAAWEWVQPGSSTSCGLALAAMQRAIVSDIEASPLMTGTEDLDLFRLSGIRAMQSTPLFSRRGRLVGMISTHWREPKDLAKEDLVHFDALARQAADLIERTHAEQAIARHARDQAELYRLTDRLHRAGPIEDVYDAAIDAIVATLGCHRASVLLFDEAGVMRFVAWRGLSESYRKAVDGHSPWTPSTKSPDSIFISDIEKSDESEALRAVFREEGIRALGFIPLVSKGRVVGKFMTYYDEPRDFSEGEMSLALNISSQLGFTIAKKRSDAALQQKEEHLQQIMNSAKEYAIITLDSKGIVTSWNEGARRILGYEEAEVIGQPAEIFFTPEDRDAKVPEQEMHQAQDDGRAANERWHLRKDGSRFWGSGVMLPLERGDQPAYLKIFRDQTEEKLAEESQQLLINELNHRVKNTLATVQSITNQTLRGALVDKNIRASLDSRLSALSRSHDILTEEKWESARLIDVVAHSLQPFAPQAGLSEKFLVKGPDIRLSPKAALSLGMGLHELATNASKYGALSVPSGQVIIHWDVDRSADPEMIKMIWQEIKGPRVAEPTRKGFGSRLIEQALSYDLKAKVSVNYAPGGFRFEVVLPRNSEIIA